MHSLRSAHTNVLFLTDLLIYSIRSLPGSRVVDSRSEKYCPTRRDLILTSWPSVCFSESATRMQRKKLTEVMMGAFDTWKNETKKSKQVKKVTRGARASICLGLVSCCLMMSPRAM